MTDRKIWSANEAFAWDLTGSKRKTIREIEFLKWAFEKFAEKKVETVLDLACGTGRLGLELSRMGYSVTGIDRSSEMIARANENARKKSVELNLINTSLEELDLTGQFDAAYCVEAIYYIQKEIELASFLDKLHSLMRPGGVLIIDTMNFASLYGKFKKVITAYQSGRNWSVNRRITHEVDDVNLLWYHNIETDMKIKEDGKARGRKWEETHVLRMWTFPELRTKLLDHGFSGIHLFGQMKAESKEATINAGRLVIVTIRD